MKFNRLGSSGLVVSKLCFGAGALGVGGSATGLKKNIPQQMANQIIGMCLDAGITIYDCSDNYLDGQSEIVLGKSLGNRRKDIVLCTKTGEPSKTPEKNDSQLHYRHIIESCEGSLKRMGTDYVDIFYAHDVDYNTPMEETARAFEQLVQTGKARYVAISNWPAWRTAHFQGIQQRMGYAPVVCNQIFYNLLGRMSENDLVPLCLRSGLGLIGYEALAGGFLTGKYTRENPIPAGSRREMFSRENFERFDIEPGYDVAATLVKLAPKYNATAARLALAYAMSKPWMNSVIFGVTKIEQLVDNLGAATLVMAEEDIAMLDKMTTPPP